MHDSTRIPDGIQEGHWSEKPKKWKPELLDVDKLRGKIICDTCTYAGTYGMGGPGFLALELKGMKKYKSEKYLIFGLWSAIDWMLLNNKQATEDNIKNLIGNKIESLTLSKHFIRLVTDKNILIIPDDLSLVNVWQGTGEVRCFGVNDDIAKATFLSPSLSVVI